VIFPLGYCWYDIKKHAAPITTYFQQRENDVEFLKVYETVTSLLFVAISIHFKFALLFISISVRCKFIYSSTAVSVISVFAVIIYLSFCSFLASFVI